MKKVIPVLMLVFFSTILNAQNNYNNLWEKVHKFELNNLPKSALKIIEDIYTKAEKDNNSPQLVKCLFYKSKFSQTLEEDAQLKIVNQFKEHIAKSIFPTNQVLENVLANLYWQYFNQHRWQFYNRTQTESKVDSKDFRTWDLNTLFTEIQKYYNASLENRTQLQKIDIHTFSDILHLAKDSKKYRPTLYDFLAHNALEFYKTDENNITKPAYQFKLDNTDLLSDAKTFTQLDLTTKDTLSLQFNALKVYQDLIDFHLRNKNLDALVDVDLQRLTFVNQHATFNDKQQVYLQTLEASKKPYKNNAVSGLYEYEIATIYNQQADSYQPKTKEEHRFKKKEALAICENIIEKFPKSDGAKKCAVLKQQILSKSLQITAEEYIPINTYSRLLVNYKNLNKLHFSIYEISENQRAKLDKSYKEKEKALVINQLKKINSWFADLKNENDYQQHATEVVIPKLAQGSYLIVASSEENINPTSVFGYTNIDVTNLTFISNNVNGNNIYQIVDRVTGKPITGARVNLNNKPHNRYSQKLYKNFITDKNGEFTFNVGSNIYYGSGKATVKTDNDTAIFKDVYFNNYRENRNTHKAQAQTFVFTDRSIYRPGQTVYFKGISIERFKKESKIVSDKNAFVEIKDVNGQKIKNFNLTTNEFGSFSGEFVLPNSGLTGEFHIQVNVNGKRDYHYFSVEEYKRPKFEVDFKPVTESYTINDEISVTGFAKAFAGTNITDAKVVYRVHRKVQYPNWWYWYRPYFSSEPQEIKNGKLTTDEKGNFIINFKALADESVNKKDLPVFTYEITTDVTDLNGETRSATTTVKVGCHAMTATIEMNAVLNTSDKNKTLKIDTKNLNGEFVPATGTIKIYKLIPPANPLRKRPWNAPDYQTLSEKEFKEKFPNDAYKNEDNYINWEKGIMVFTSDFNTAKEKEIKLKSIKNWQSGKYVVELDSQDKFNQKVTDKQFFSVVSDKDKLPTDNKLFKVSTDKEEYKIGETAKITISTNSNDITVMLYVEKQHKITDTYHIHLNKNSKTIKVPVTKDDEGGFGIKWYFVNYNSFENGSKVIKVPYPKTDLEIETKTFRDKLQPGKNQTWSFTLKGSKKDKVFAEVLASMYDASLDQFKPHEWNFNPIQQPNYYIHPNSNAYYSFGNNSFRIFNLNAEDKRLSYPRHSYDKLNWFGFDFNGNRWVNKNYLIRIGLFDNAFEKSGSFNGIVSGKMKDSSHDPLPFGNVFIKGTNQGVTTDKNGNFSMKVNKSDILIFSFIGYETLELKIDNFSQLTITMIENGTTLDEVAVVGYAKRKMAQKSNTLRSPSPEKMVMVQNEAEVSEMVIETTEEDESTAFNYAGQSSDKKEEKKNPLKGIQIRKNLQETAFFYPHLTTDKKGNVTFNFTVPEALTKWKLQLLAHTKELHSATKTLETVTQKELMVTPNAPRFLREGDKITLSSKISNLSNRNLQGTAQLLLTDAVTGKDINLFDNATKNQSFSVDKNGNTSVSWSLSIPDNVSAVQYKVIAKAGDFSDGEQNALPVLTNRTLVTETIPMWVRSNQTKTFTLDKLKNNSSASLKHHKLTLEVTSNPAWYAVQALPYLMEYPYECAEQTFARYYANALASHIANSNPRIQEVFNSWKSSGALLSNLEKNQELKSLIIQETPWLRDAQSETEQKKRIALLFDLNKMKNQQQNAIYKLEQMQLSGGGFPWFRGGYSSNPYITQYIASGFGHLKQLGVTNFKSSTKEMIQNSVQFLDKKIAYKHQELLKRAEKTKERLGKQEYEKYLAKKHIGYFEIQYLYMRSFYTDISIPSKTKKAVEFYKKQSANYWNDFNLYGKGLIALAQFRTADKTIATKILNSLRENSITSEELGMYWKSNTAGYYNYQAPIETQALLIEAFSEIENDTKTIDNLKIWLLKNKQVSRWKTTKATSEAVYALLLQGSDWVSTTELVDVKLGDIEIDPTKMPEVQVEAGTGYFKTSWNGHEITPKMSEVTLTSKGKTIAWGGLYWQYFEDLDKITSAETPLKLKKKLFKKVNSDTGKKLIEVTDNSTLKVGDLLTVRIELRADRDMEFIHMKDMRASGVEPINILSQYKWQDGLGYYESTKDASTNFFFDRLPKGVYVFEYDVRVNNAGNFSNGITTIESMYAPEFKSHSEGVRIKVK